MAMKAVLFVAAALAICGVAAATARHVGVDVAPTNHGPALGWQQVGKAASDETVTVTVAVKQGCSADRLEEELMAVSDPTSARYGQFMTLEQVRDLVASTPEALATVTKWLESADGKDITIAGTRDFVTATVSVAAIEETLLPGTAMHVFHKPSPRGRTRRVVRSNSGSARLPAAVHAVVDAIEGVYDFPGSRSASMVESRGKTNARQAAAQGSSDAPVISITGGVDSGVFVLVAPACKDGSAPVTVPAGQPLCSSPSIKLVSVTVESPFDTATASVSGINTANGTACSAVDGAAAVCAIGVANLVNYRNYTVSAQVTYDDGSTSSIATFGYPAVPSAWVTPQAIRKFYNIPDSVNGEASGNSQAVIEFDDQYYSTSDLATFTAVNNLPTPDVIVVGGNNASLPGGEATLDIQLVTAVGTRAPTFFWYSKGYLLQYLAEISSTKYPPLVQSISYGTPEVQSIKANVLRANSEFAKAGLRGITVISTAGDLGVSDGVGCGAEFYADFPSSSPYTTSLGATSIARLPPSVSPVCTPGTDSAFGVPVLCAPVAEVPCALDAGAGFTTGGMFSGIFGRPSYQNSFVEGYLSTANPPISMFNSSGRAYNDVAAFGNNILVVDGGVFQASGGTSASGPIFAGVVSLLNSELMRAGKSSLGFFNPTLYSIAKSAASDSYAPFNTVFGGNNQCGEQQCCPSGLPGTINGGWSPLGGLGSPNFGGLLQAVMAAKK